LCVLFSTDIESYHIIHHMVRFR